MCEGRGCVPVCFSCGKVGVLRASRYTRLNGNVQPCPRTPGQPLFNEFHARKCETCNGHEYVFVAVRVFHATGKLSHLLTRPLNRVEARAYLKKQVTITEHDVTEALK